MFSKIFNKNKVNLNNSNFRITYIPPLLIYLAAGCSGITNIVSTFYVKDYLNLSASFLAALGFWLTLPWALKMPIGHIVDLMWRKKHVFVYLGAIFISTSFLIMFALIAYSEMMTLILKKETWFIVSSILAPIGFVFQDVVADAMTVEAIPKVKQDGTSFNILEIKSMHITMQTLGRFFIIGGTVLVGSINIFFFKNIDNFNDLEKLNVYSDIYLFSLVIPLISVMGVILNKFLINSPIKVAKTKANYKIIFGSIIFVLFIIITGLKKFTYSQELVFAGSMIIVIFLMKHLAKFMSDEARNLIIGTSIIIFVFRSVPNVGIGLTWFEIDILKFDQSFFSILAMLASILTMIGILIFKNFMARNSIAKIMVVLSILNAILLIPSLAMYYGFHEWTSKNTSGIIDARFIALINTAIESPLGQVSMIPLLAWIAKNAPDNLKATFFAVFASFTNLALGLSNLMTKYLNKIFIISREVRDKVTNEVIITANYSELGLLICVTIIITLCIPIFSVIIIQKSRYKTNE